MITLSKITNYNFIKTNQAYLFLLLLIGCTFLFGKSELTIEDVKLDPEGIVTKRDANGKYCAAIRVVSELKGLRYTAYNGVVAVEHKPGEDIVFLSANERVLKIYVAGYTPKKIILSEHNIDLQKRKIWEMKVTGDRPPQKIPTTILTKPKDATIYLDGKKYDSIRSTKITKGQHSIKIYKPGYRKIKKNIMVSDSTTFFDYNLEKLKPVKTTLRSNPEEAQIFLDNVHKGYTNKQLFLLPDDYELRLNKEGFDYIQDTIKIRDGQTNNFTYSLYKTSTRIIVNTEPREANVYLNNEKQTPDTLNVAPGNYKIKILAQGYLPQTDIIKVDQNTEKNLKYTLQPRTGSLKLQVKPIEAGVILKKKDRVVDGWTGSKYRDNLPAGKYLIKVFADNYKNRNLYIDIKENHTRSLTLDLKNKDKNQTEGKRHYSKFVYLKGDTFTMGDTWEEGNRNEKPPHQVIVDDMYISKYEVTHAEYITFLNNTDIQEDFSYKDKLLMDPNKDWCTIGYKNNRFYFKGSKYASAINTPVIGVTFFGALAYCNWKSKQEGYEPVYTFENGTIRYNRGANGYRLPTEAEWEFAAKISDSKTTQYSGTDQKEKLSQYAWYKKMPAQTLILSVPSNLIVLDYTISMVMSLNGAGIFMVESIIPILL